MILVIDKDDWINSFDEYYTNFDVDYEISIYREDPHGSYCNRFTTRESVDDFEDWDSYIHELVCIAKSEGKYDFKKILRHDYVNTVLLFPSEMYDLEELDDMDDDELLGLSMADRNNVKTYKIDDYVFNVNKDPDFLTGKYVKVINI